MTDAWAVIVAAMVGAVAATVPTWITRSADRRDRRHAGFEERKQFLRGELLDLAGTGRERIRLAIQLSSHALKKSDEFFAEARGDLGSRNREMATAFRTTLDRIALSIDDASIVSLIEAVRTAEKSLQRANDAVGSKVIMSRQDPPDVKDAISWLMEAGTELERELDALLAGAASILADPISDKKTGS